MSELVDAAKLVLIFWAISIASVVGSAIVIGIVNSKQVEPKNEH